MEDPSESIRGPGLLERATTVLVQGATTVFARGVAVVAAMALALAGCATGFTSSSVEEFGTFRIDVTNDLAPRAEIYLQSNIGGPPAAAEGILLGSAPVEGTTVFRIDVEDPEATYRLRALMPRDQEVISEAFVPTEVGPGIHWTLSDNLLAEGTSGEATGARTDGTDGNDGSDGGAGDRDRADDRDRGDGRAPADDATAGNRSDRGGTRSPTGARVLPPGG